MQSKPTADIALLGMPEGVTAPRRAISEHQVIPVVSGIEVEQGMRRARDVCAFAKSA